MLTTQNTGPYSQFNQKYYDNLKATSFQKAEEYRLSVTKPNKQAIDLGAIWQDEFLVQQKKQIERREKDMKKVRKLDIQRQQERAVIDLWQEWAVARLYNQINPGSVWKEEIEDEDDIIETDDDPITDPVPAGTNDPTDTINATDVADALKELEDAQNSLPNDDILPEELAKATPDAPIDLWQDGWDAYEVTIAGVDYQITFEQVNEARLQRSVEDPDGTKVMDDQEIINYMFEQKLAPFNA